MFVKKGPYGFGEMTCPPEGFMGGIKILRMVLK